MGPSIFPRWLQGLAIIAAILVVIFLVLLLTQEGVPDVAKRCATSIWKAEFPRWLGCAMSQHENLAGGLIAAGGALFAGWLAWSAVREQIAVEQASTEPEVVAYLIPDRRHINILHIVVANVGRGAAREVSVELDADPADFTAHQTQIPAKTRRPVLAVLPAGEQVPLFFGSALDLLADPPLKDFKIVVRFIDKDGNHRSNVGRASAVDFEGHGRIGTPPEFETAEGITAIAKELKNWSDGFKRLKVETITAEEEAERQQRAHEQARERLAARRQTPKGGDAAP